MYAFRSLDCRPTGRWWKRCVLDTHILDPAEVHELTAPVRFRDGYIRLDPDFDPETVTAEPDKRRRRKGA